MRWLAAVAVTVVACTGGGSTATPETPAPPRATKALACYWYEDMGAALETVDHTSCVEAGQFDAGGLQQLQVLSMVGDRRVILMVPACVVPVDQVESELTFWFQRIATAGYLKNIAAVRPCDEPDDAKTGHSDAEMKIRLTAVHAAMAKFPELVGKPLAIYYQCGTTTRPGIDFVDWMGCDRYDHSCDVFAEAYGLFEDYVNKEPDRRLMTISGGASPFKQDPTCMVDKVLADGRYALLDVFLWQTTIDQGNVYTGVRDNGLAPLHRTQLQRLR